MLEIAPDAEIKSNVIGSYPWLSDDLAGRQPRAGQSHVSGGSDGVLSLNHFGFLDRQDGRRGRFVRHPEFEPMTSVLGSRQLRLVSSLAADNRA